jgi:BCD family chlorophyll transporter-like MFS transporter
MNSLSARAMQAWASLGPRYMPFADAATAEVPLSRLLRLSLFQVTVGMTLVLLVGTLNRVMIVELKVPATLVGVMIALPVLFAPLRAWMGFRSDQHRSALGWRRVPYIWKGTMLQFGGLAIMPFALLVLSGYGQAAQAPAWIGYAGAATAFLMLGAGVNLVQTVGLALATDLVPPEKQARVVGLMGVMMLAGMLVSALVFGAALADYTPLKLVQVIQASAVVTVVLNGLALWQQEGRRRWPRDEGAQATPRFRESLATLAMDRGLLRRLSVVALGTLGFGMGDVLLEPYGGQVLGLPVAETTRLTAVLAIGGIVGFILSARLIGRGRDALGTALLGILLGLPAFGAIILAAPTGSAALFVCGTGLVGLGAGLFGHGTLTATMNSAPPDRAGLALGVWGAVQATTAGAGTALGGVLRDLLALLPGDVLPMLGTSAALPYLAVYALEAALLAAAALACLPLIARMRRVR